MFALSVSMTFPADRFAEVKQRVIQLAAQSRQDAGCVEYWWAEMLEEPNSLRLFEVWESPAILQEHLQLPHEVEWMTNWQTLATNVDVHTYDPTTRGTMGPPPE